MITNNNNGRDLDITELPTDEYPVLSESALLMVQTAAEPSIACAPAETKDEPKAALSLTHLEAEVARLHAKWQSIDAEFGNREALIAQLNEEIAARESTIARLTADLERDAAARVAADEHLMAKGVEIAALVREQRARDERIEALSKEAADAEGKHKEVSEKLTRAAAETARLNDVVLRERATVQSLGERNRQALAEHEALQTKLQDLEIYINGRHDRWSDLNAELAALKDALRVKEETIKARDSAIAGHIDEQRRLEESIHDLERQCAELVGRRKEREEAYDELQKQLASQLAQAEQGKLAAGELAAAKAGLRERVDELEKTAAEGAQQLQAVGDDLRKSQEQLRVTQGERSDLAAQLAATNDSLDRKSREADRLTDERDAALKDSARIRAELDTLGAHANELGKLRAEALAQAKQLEAALVARDELVSKLETELRAKQVTADLLERSVGRIADLGASLAALDERMNGGAGKRIANLPALPAADFAATLAADDGLEAAAPRPNVAAEAVPADLGALVHQRIIDIGERTRLEAGRKLVVTIDGQSFDYPILKKQMTIGRGHDSDIRVASHFISRVHAKIRMNGAVTIIEDAGSKNGVLVNSERVLRRVLHDGDIVTLGDDLNMRFVDATH